MNSVLIVGAGLAGLTCARRLREGGVDATILDRGDGVGGRVRTDEVEGFRLDRGFQVLLTAYPEARRWLDFDALDVRAFWPGAEVWADDKWSRVADPRRRWSDLISSLVADVGSTADKLRVVQWAMQAGNTSPEAFWTEPETTSLQFLRDRGFSERMIERFWRPWLQGIFLEPELSTSSRMLEFVFGMFTRGAAVVPRRGMGAISEQLAAGLDPDKIQLNVGVEMVETGHARDSWGNAWRAGNIVLATDVTQAGKLRFGAATVTWRAARCLYFAADQAPRSEPMLMLNGAVGGVVNHVAVMSAVSRDYAPVGQELIMVGIRAGEARSNAEVEAAATEELRAMYGAPAGSWRLLRHSWIQEALPTRFPLEETSPGPVAPGIWRCGDYASTASIQGAMESGRKTAEALLAWM